MRPAAFASYAVSLAVHGAVMLAAVDARYTLPISPPYAGGQGDGVYEVRLGAAWQLSHRPPERALPAVAPPPDPIPAAPEVAPETAPEVAEAHTPETAAEPAPEPAPKPTPETAPEPEPEVASAPPGPDSRAGIVQGPGTEAPRIADPNALRPVYPPRCRRLGHEGTAIVRITVGADGNVLAAELVSSAGCPDLDQAALAAARRARFLPARSNGVAIISVVEQAFVFQLRARPLTRPP